MNNKKLNAKRTGLPGGKVPKHNQKQGIKKVPGMQHTDGITQLPKHLAKSLF